MAISQSKYIDITSGVGGEPQVSRRELIGRIITTSSLVPVNEILEFNQTQASSYFGASSDEAEFASKYFAFISKTGRQANKISFARYVNAGAPASIRSSITFSSLTPFISVEDGAFDVIYNGNTTSLSSLDFSQATSFEDVVSEVNSALTTAGVQVVLSFENGAFLLAGVVSGNNTLSVASPESGTDLLPLFGFDAESDPIISEGYSSESPVECMIRTTGLSDNYGSFAFLQSLSASDMEAIAQWNAGKNEMFMYSEQVNFSNYQDVQAALSGQDGTAITYDANNAYAKFMPMVLLATTAYNSGRSAVKNYMYQMFDSEIPSVSDDTLSQALDALKINYLGSTSQAGSTIAFYQDGVLQGSISDMGVYCNEIWLKDAIKVEFMNLLTGLEQIPANGEGRGLARGCLQGVIDEALVNGVIMAGKSLTKVQQAYITSLTNDVNAWRSVENLGYWLDVEIQQYVENEITKYKVNYLLVYSKGDSIRKVEGTDILI